MIAARAEGARDVRLPLAIVAAAALAGLAPRWALLVGPIVFGVPHVIGDVRALWLRKPGGFAGKVALRVALALLAMTALRATALCGVTVPVEAELTCGVAAVALAAIGGARERRAQVLWALGVAVVGALAIAAARETLLVLAHAHNLVAVALWLAWCPRASAAREVAVTYALGACGVVLLSQVSFQDQAIGAFEGARITRELAPSLAPGLADALVRSFAFAQLVHYGIWSWQLPGQSRASLREDLGSVGLAACALLCIAVPVCGLWAPVETRSTYLQLAIAHGWLELSVIAFLLARGTSARTS